MNNENKGKHDNGDPGGNPGLPVHCHCDRSCSIERKFTIHHGNSSIQGIKYIIYMNYMFTTVNPHHVITGNVANN
jgi:hypothetical protein